MGWGGRWGAREMNKMIPGMLLSWTGRGSQCVIQQVLSIPDQSNLMQSRGGSWFAVCRRVWEMKFGDLKLCLRDCRRTPILLTLTTRAWGNWFCGVSRQRQRDYYDWGWRWDWTRRRTRCLICWFAFFGTTRGGSGWAQWPCPLWTSCLLRSAHLRTY